MLLDLEALKAACILADASSIPNRVAILERVTKALAGGTETNADHLLALAQVVAITIKAADETSTDLLARAFAEALRVALLQPLPEQAPRPPSRPSLRLVSGGK